MTVLFTEHSSAVAESQIKRTTTSKKSDNCSDRLPYPSASRSFVCRVHGLCLVLTENMTICKNSFGSPKCECFASILLLPLFILQHYFGLPYNLPPFSEGPTQFLFPLYSNTLQPRLPTSNVVSLFSLLLQLWLLQFFVSLFDFHSFNITRVS